MAEFNGSTFSGTTLDAAASPPFDTPHGAKVGAKVRRTVEIITCASQASGSTFPIARRPIGSMFAGCRVTVSATLGSATLAIGVSGTAAKYAAAATYTSADAPALVGKASALDDDPLTAPETMILTTAAASLPSSGTIVVETFYTTPA